MITKELLKLPVADLVPYENNPRVIFSGIHKRLRREYAPVQCT